MGHDNGAEPGSSFGHDNRQSEIDFGYRAVHLTVVAAKHLVDAYYGRAPEYSYFNGCSTGGKQGLTEAQRYPEDYDGIVVGHPNFDQIGNRAQYVWNGQSTFGASPAAPLAGPKLALINSAATAACDALDGVVDGVIDDPRKCPFLPASLLCAAGQDPATCLTQLEVSALEKVYAGPRNPRTGASIYPGLVKGSERGWGGHTAGPNIFSTADQFFKFMVFQDPAWDYRGFDFDADYAYAVDNFGHIINATSPDLEAFRKRGGKILYYHSYRSTTHTAPKSIEYYDEVAALFHKGKGRNDGYEKVQSFFRLFMAPGGSGNKGPDKFDPLPYLERWVEQGVAPDRIIASNITSGVVDRTRPLRGAGREVVVFVDTFNRWFEPHNARAAMRVLQAAGYKVSAAQPLLPGRPLCCGRTFLTAGMVAEAKVEARRTLEDSLNALTRQADAPRIGATAGLPARYRPGTLAEVQAAGGIGRPLAALGHL